MYESSTSKIFITSRPVRMVTLCEHLHKITSEERKTLNFRGVSRIKRVEQTLQTIGWIACVIYATIPSFWLLIHPRVEFWRSRPRSPYRILLPAWIAMWLLLAVGLILYKFSGSGFSPAQLGGLPELLSDHSQQHLVTTGIRARVRHPVYLGHLCEMLAWSTGTGLTVCWALTAFAVVTGAVMIRLEDNELENRFGEEYCRYRSTVPAVLPFLRPTPHSIQSQ